MPDIELSRREYREPKKPKPKAVANKWHVALYAISMGLYYAFTHHH